MHAERRLEFCDDNAFIHDLNMQVIGLKNHPNNLINCKDDYNMKVTGYSISNYLASLIGNKTSHVIANEISLIQGCEDDSSVFLILLL